MRSKLLEEAGSSKPSPTAAIYSLCASLSKLIVCLEIDYKMTTYYLYQKLLVVKNSQHCILCFAIFGYLLF